MANYRSKPRVIIESSPLGDFIQKLPETALSFIKLQNQLQFNADEKQRDREFQLEKMEITDRYNQLNTRRKLFGRLKEEAIKNGVSIDENLIKLPDLNRTSNQGSIRDNIFDSYNTQINYYDGGIKDLEKTLALFDAGQSSALILDRDYNRQITTDELNKFQKEFPDQELTDSWVKGAKHYFKDPANQEGLRKRSASYSTGEMLKALDNPKLFPQLAENKNFLAANINHKRDPNDINTTGKLITAALTDVPSASKRIDEATKQQSSLIKTTFESFASQYGALDEDFTKGLPLTGQESYDKSAFENPEAAAQTADLAAQNLAIFFSGKTQDGANSPTDVNAGWVKDIFSDSGGWDDYEYAVEQVMADPRFEEFIASEPVGTVDTWWPDSENKKASKAAANNFFRTNVKLYKQLNEAGSAFSPSIMENLKKNLGDPMDSKNNLDSNNNKIQSIVEDKNLPMYEQMDSKNNLDSNNNKIQSILEKEVKLNPMQQVKANRNQAGINVLKDLGSGVRKVLKQGARNTYEQNLMRGYEILNRATTEDTTPYVTEELMFNNNQETLDSLNAFGTDIQNLAETGNSSNEDILNYIANRDITTPTPDSLAETVKTLSFLNTNPDSSAVADSALAAINIIDNNNKAQKLIDTVMLSPAIREQFMNVNQNIPVQEIVKEWEEDGSPEIYDWLTSTFPEIEPELIR